MFDEFPECLKEPSGISPIDDAVIEGEAHREPIPSDEPPMVLRDGFARDGPDA